MSFSDMKIENKGKFVKIESGQPQVLRILENTPCSKMIHGFGKEAVDCTGEGCFKCIDGIESQQRFEVNVFSQDEKRVMVFGFGAGIANKLKTIAKTLESQEMQILDVDLHISATGSNKSKVYTIQPMLKSKSVPSGLRLFDIGNKKASSAALSKEPDEIPF